MMSKLWKNFRFFLWLKWRWNLTKIINLREKELKEVGKGI